MSSTPHFDAVAPPTIPVVYLFSQGGIAKGNKATFSPRQLNVIWGNDSRYWKMPEKDGPAGLLQVCWLEVSGSLRIGSVPLGTRYKISFQISLKSDAFGWNNCPVYVMAKFGKKGKYSWKKTTLPASSSAVINIPTDDLEIEVKDNLTIDANDTIYFGLYEVWSGKWKGGLLLHSATVEVA